MLNLPNSFDKIWLNLLKKILMMHKLTFLQPSSVAFELKNMTDPDLFLIIFLIII